MTNLSEAKRLSVSGMSCAGCVAAVEQALRGVTETNVNFAEHHTTLKDTADARADQCGVSSGSPRRSRSGWAWARPPTSVSPLVLARTSPWKAPT